MGEAGAGYTPNAMSRKGRLVRSALLSPENLQDLLAAVDAYGTRHELSARDLYPVKLALDELGTNLLVHGSLPNVRPEMRLRLEHDTRRLQFVVQDNGPAVRPDKGPPETNPGAKQQSAAGRRTGAHTRSGVRAKARILVRGRVERAKPGSTIGPAPLPHSDRGTPPATRTTHTPPRPPDTSRKRSGQNPDPDPTAG